MELNASDLNERIWTFERDHPGVGLWKMPGYDGPLSCELCQLEPEGPMTGVEEAWRVDGMTVEQMREVVATGFDDCAAVPGARLCVNLMELPLFEFTGHWWDVGPYDGKDQVRLRRNMPLGLMLLMREVLAPSQAVA
jgi:hypothetical protein